MDIELLLAHPKQNGNGRKSRHQPMVIHHFQVLKTVGRYGSGAHPKLDLLADLVSRKPHSESSDDSAETISIASCQTHDESDTEDGKVKPKRKRANARQLSILKQTFQQTPFPTSEVRKKLAKELGMTARSVQIWFQNQRQMARNLLPHAEDS
jgi:transcriptional regulator GlxA family with amidase domain